MKKAVVGILAHVDAGKTTLAEAMLYRCGKLKKPGRVDHGDTALDTHALERERGITIFAGQARLCAGGLEMTLLDTPGHVDFSAETERTLQVLDCAVLVISGTNGVQAHTRTLWKLLDHYRIPVCLFVTKTDLPGPDRAQMMQSLRAELSPACLDFSPGTEPERAEELAVCREDYLDAWLQSGALPADAEAELFRSREVFPCLFGSGLKLEGVDGLLSLLERLVLPAEYPEKFGARVYKISYDSAGTRLTHLKVTGGTLRVRDTVEAGGVSEKISQIRLYSGAKYETAEEVSAGGVCAVCGLTATKSGDVLGDGAAAPEPVLEPVMNYRLELPADCDIRVLLPKLRTLEEEDPRLHLVWDTRLHELRVGLMGEVQAEILKSVIADRFGVCVTIGEGHVLYRETIEDTVEGVGHYEPLRHYAEVHLLLRPLPRGSGLVFDTVCSEDALDRNWQRLILTHLAEKTHLGVLTGAPLTDVKLTLVSGRAHLKHTEGGDFRQATYRAVRQGLMKAKSVLLEPYYRFRLEIPSAQVGRAITDIRAMSGSFDTPETDGAVSVLTGKAPVSAMNGYAKTLASWSRGTGKLQCELCGYDLCRDADRVMEQAAYDPQADLENSPDSVFCAHGGGFSVPWDKVGEYMHLESCLKEPKQDAPRVIHRNLHLDEKELEAIMEREFGPVKRPLYRMPAAVSKAAPERELPPPPPAPRYLIADGYNLVFAWEELRNLAQADLEGARIRLLERLCNFSAFTKTETVVVFDGRRGSPGTKSAYRNIKVVYTAENEAADAYIEKMTAEIGKNERVRVITSDAMIQLAAVRSGVLRTSSREFEREVDAAEEELSRCLAEMRVTRMSTVGERQAAAEEECPT